MTKLTEHTTNAEIEQMLIEDGVHPAVVERKSEWKVPPEEKRCVVVKEDGERCRTYRLKNSDKCSGHSGLAGKNLDSKKASEASRLARAKRQAEEAQKPKTIREVLHRKFLENAEEITTNLINKSKTDPKIALSVINQTEGNPKQPIEQSGGIALDGLKQFDPTKASLEEINEYEKNLFLALAQAMNVPLEHIEFFLEKNDGS